MLRIYGRCNGRLSSTTPRTFACNLRHLPAPSGKSGICRMGMELEGKSDLGPTAGGVRRILAIDGGGIKGAFPAAFLAQIEERVGEPIADYFDLIAGTSTGGIIALGLGLGLSAKEILELYEKNGRRIFPHSLGFSFRGVFRAKYAKAALPDVLKEVF